jgi:hypothetical protein
MRSRYKSLRKTAVASKGLSSAFDSIATGLLTWTHSHCAASSLDLPTLDASRQKATGDSVWHLPGHVHAEILNTYK